MFDPNMPAELRGKPRPKGLTPACWLAAGPAPYLPAIGPDTAPADARALPWFAAKYGCEAVLLGDVLGWSGNVLSPAPAGKARLFYPGTIAGLEEPLASVRLKRLRRGLQDTAYLWILGRHDKRAVARRALDEMIRYGGLGATRDNYLDCRLGGWVSDGATWSLARHVLAVEVQAAVAPEKAATAGGAVPSPGRGPAEEADRIAGDRAHAARPSGRRPARSRPRPTGSR